MPIRALEKELDLTTSVENKNDGLEVYTIGTVIMYTGPIHSGPSPMSFDSYTHGWGNPGVSGFGSLSPFRRKEPEPLSFPPVESQKPTIDIDQIMRGLKGLSHEVEPAKKTTFFDLGEDNKYTFGVTHHPIGLDKFKVFDKKEECEYGLPVSDIMRNWRIDMR